MAKKDKRKQLGWMVPKMARERFIDFCQSIGVLAQDEAAGALLYWITLPPQTREEYKILAKNLTIPSSGDAPNIQAGYASQ